MIKRIRLSSFKSFRERTEIHLIAQNGVVTIEGPNGTGKSTLLKAVSNCLGATQGTAIQSFFPAGQTNTIPLIEIVLIKQNADLSIAKKAARAAAPSVASTGEELTVELSVQNGRKTWKINGKITQQQHLHHTLGFIPGLVEQQTTASLVSDPLVLRELLVQACKATTLHSAYRAASSKVKSIEADAAESSKQAMMLATIVAEARRMEQVVQQKKWQQAATAFRIDLQDACKHSLQLQQATQTAIRTCQTLMNAKLLQTEVGTLQDTLQKEKDKCSEMESSFEVMEAAKAGLRLKEAQMHAIHEQLKEANERKQELNDKLETQERAHQQALDSLRMFLQTETENCGSKHEVVYGGQVLSEIEAINEQLRQQSALLRQIQFFSRGIVPLRTATDSSVANDLDSLLAQGQQLEAIVQTVSTSRGADELLPLVELQTHLFKAPSLLQGTSYHTKVLCASALGKSSEQLPDQLQELKRAATHVMQQYSVLQQNKYTELGTTVQPTSFQTATKYYSPASHAGSATASFTSQSTKAGAVCSWGDMFGDMQDDIRAFAPSLSAALAAMQDIRSSSAASIIEACQALTKVPHPHDNSHLQHHQCFVESPFMGIDGVCGQVRSVLALDYSLASEWQAALQATVKPQQLNKLVCTTSQSMQSVLKEAKHQQSAVVVLPLDSLQVNNELLTSKRALIRKFNASSAVEEKAICPTELLRLDTTDTALLGEFMFQSVVFVHRHVDAQTLLGMCEKLPIRVVSKDGTQHQQGWLSGGKSLDKASQAGPALWMPIERAVLFERLSSFGTLAQAFIESCTCICKLQFAWTQSQQVTAKNDALFPGISVLQLQLAKVLNGSGVLKWGGQPQQSKSATEPRQQQLEIQLQQHTSACQAVEEELTAVHQQLAELSAQLVASKGDGTRPSACDQAKLASALAAGKENVDTIQSNLAHAKRQLSKLKQQKPDDPTMHDVDLFRDSAPARPVSPDPASSIIDGVDLAMEAAALWAFELPRLLNETRSLLQALSDQDGKASATSLQRTLNEAQRLHDKFAQHSIALDTPFALPAIAVLESEIVSLRHSLQKSTGAVNAQFDSQSVHMIQSKGEIALKQVEDGQNPLQAALKQARAQLKACHLLLCTLLRRVSDRVNSALASFVPQVLPNFHCCVKMCETDEISAHIELRQVTAPGAAAAQGPARGAQGGGSVVDVLELSGGQRTLASLVVLLAIAHIDHKPLYIFDEIDAALDEKNRSAVARLVHSMFSSKAMVLLVSHHPELQAAADQTIQVRLNESGSSTASSKR